MSALAGQIIGGCGFLVTVLILFKYGFSRIKDQDKAIEKKADKEEVEKDFARGDARFKEMTDTQKEQTKTLGEIHTLVLLQKKDFDYLKEKVA